MPFEQVPLGNTGLKVGRMGLGTAYGLDAKAIEWAVDQGLNYIFWGSIRRGNVPKALRAMGPSRRGKVVIAVAAYVPKVISYPRFIRFSLERALKRLDTEYIDIFQLGWIQEEPGANLMDFLHRQKEKGLIHHIGITTHNRRLAARLLKSSPFDVFMIRYNAAHRGAETEIFPYVDPARHAIVTYTATRWGQLLNAPQGWPENRPVPKPVDCYRFVLSHPKVTLCLTGAKNIKELQEDIRALELGPMSEDKISWMSEFGNLVRARRFALFDRKP